MPRSNLPTELKSLKILHIDITKHAEKDVWDIMCKKFEELKPMMQEKKSKQNYTVEWAMKNNPYKNYSWSNSYVTHERYNFFEVWTNGEIDKWYEFEDKEFRFLQDFYRCNKF